MESLSLFFLYASLLPDRKLKYLTQQPLQAQPGTHEAEELVFLWYWEDCLKQRFASFSLPPAPLPLLSLLKTKKKFRAVLVIQKP